MRRLEAKFKEKAQRVVVLEKEVELQSGVCANDTRDREILRLKKQLTEIE